jgi:hypothetical protein
MKRTWSQWLAGLALGLLSTAAQAQNMVVVPASSLPPAQPILSPATTSEYIPSGETIVQAEAPMTTAPAALPDAAPRMGLVPVQHTQIISHNDANGVNRSGNSIYGSAGVLLIQPVWQRNAAAFTIAAPGGGPITLNVDDFHWSMRAAPEMTLGVKNCEGLGLRVHWFQFDQGEQRTVQVPAGGVGIPANIIGIGAITFGAGTSLFTESGLALNVWDFELTQDAQLGRWNMVLGGGVRYAHMNQEYNAFGVIDLAIIPPIRNSLISGHNFNGAGPSVFLEAHRPLGNQGFGVYGQTRASLLFGSAKHVSHLISQTGVVLATATQYETDILPNATIELGAEYDRCIAGGSASAFFQVGFHSQVWWNAGSAADLFGNGDANLGLVGLAIRGGLRY